MLRKGKFCIDGDPDNAILDGYTDGSFWNGWSNVYLPRESLIKWMDESPYDYMDNGDSFTFYTEDEEVFVKVEIDGMELYDMRGYCFVEIE